MTANQPTPEDRLTRLESAVLTLTEEVRTVNEEIRIVNRNIDRLADQAASDRQAWQAETNRIWNYLMNRHSINGQTDTDID